MKGRIIELNYAEYLDFAGNEVVKEQAKSASASVTIVERSIKHQQLLERGSIHLQVRLGHVALSQNPYGLQTARNRWQHKPST